MISDVITGTLRRLVTTEIRRLERWIDTLAPESLATTAG
jgi:hypothetical protein